ncbi:GIY-YIG nuclease family protein [Paraglaciecola sp. 2405UD69-4]|uniref:GIY-YIG nuclease family protein n=1 Tax=Paraglaciecola sp. 2405UD69-4 TaxID=3391836 RepID=UPI0039C97929
MTDWYVYIIENKLNQYYTGISTDLVRRFNEHQANGAKCAKALRGKGPLKLQFYCKIPSHSEALKTEVWIKKLSKANKIKLVNNQLIDSPIQNLKLSNDCPLPCKELNTL